MKTLSEQFKEWIGQLPVISDKELELYDRHFELLQKWNQQIGLVSRKSIGLAPAAHYADSVFIADTLRPHVRGNVSDLGSGAGFPGIIFAIRYPDIQVTLYEKQLRKQSFLTAAVTSLGLENVTVSGAFPDKPEVGSFTARAVLQKEELYTFLRKRLEPKSLVAINMGGQIDPSWTAPDCFLPLASREYLLPLDQGWRNVRLLERVPRGTKNG